jgi:predicted nucleotide-binding protein (sugar kinase/HSP70/actin superfamily)
MSDAVARLTAAAFRAVGVNAATPPPSDETTLTLGGACSSGEECLPHKIVIGDFLRVCQAPGFDPAKTAFFLPMAGGPCRFGQYAPYLKQVLHQQGYGDALVVAPTSADGYGAVGEQAGPLMKTVWFAVVLGDLVTRYVHRTRPYERVAGDTDAVYEEAVQALSRLLERPGLSAGELVKQAAQAAGAIGRRFRGVPADYVPGRPLIGIVGEIFCRMNTFSNEDTIRQIERLGGECWMSDLTEWIWYTNWSREYDQARTRGKLNLDYLKLRLKDHFQHRYEHALLAPVAADFVGTEEPHDIREIIAHALPYLPATGALGEMTLSVGKAIYLFYQGADGIIDISPFSCMNGITSEAVYPAVSADHDQIPIRSLYFDKVNGQVSGDLEIFLELARTYQRRKRHPRRYPAPFKTAGAPVGVA